MWVGKKGPGDTGKVGDEVESVDLIITHCSHMKFLNLHGSNDNWWPCLGGSKNFRRKNRKICGYST